MKLFHGTDKTFTVPDLNVARANTDFGKGFYLTENERAAQDWVRGREVQNVNTYELTLEEIPTCKIRIKRYEADEQWAKFVYNNRKGEIKKGDSSDIVIGPIADNGLNKLFDKIDRKEASFEEIAPKLKLIKFKALQFCFKTEAAIKLLEYAKGK